MNAIVKGISAFIAVIMSIFTIGTAAGFEPYVVEEVTTETTKITVEAKNLTWVTVGDPRVRSIEKKENDEWVTVGEYTEFTAIYGFFRPFGTFKEYVRFKNMGLSDTLSEGEYRVKVTFDLKGFKNTPHQTAYAYFTVS